MELHDAELALEVVDEAFRRRASGTAHADRRQLVVAGRRGSPAEEAARSTEIRGDSCYARRRRVEKPCYVAEEGSRRSSSRRCSRQTVGGDVIWRADQLRGSLTAQQLFNGENAVSRVFLDVIQRELVATLRQTLRPHGRLAGSV